MDICEADSVPTGQDACVAERALARKRMSTLFIIGLVKNRKDGKRQPRRLKAFSAIHSLVFGSKTDEFSDAPSALTRSLNDMKQDETLKLYAIAAIMNAALHAHRRDAEKDTKDTNEENN